LSEYIFSTTNQRIFIISTYKLVERCFRTSKTNCQSFTSIAFRTQNFLIKIWEKTPQFSKILSERIFSTLNPRIFVFSTYKLAKTCFRTPITYRQSFTSIAFRLENFPIKIWHTHPPPPIFRNLARKHIFDSYNSANICVFNLKIGRKMSQNISKVSPEFYEHSFPHSKFSDKNLRKKPQFSEILSEHIFSTINPRIFIIWTYKLVERCFRTSKTNCQSFRSIAFRPQNFLIKIWEKTPQFSKILSERIFSTLNPEFLFFRLTNWQKDASEHL
jgi:hypothetical protein